MVHRSRTDLQNLLLYRILIVEDHPLFRSAIKQLLTKTFRKIVVSEAGEAQEALHLVRSRSLDMAILDISLSGRSGTELLQDLKRVNPQLRVLVLSMFPEEQYAVRVFQRGGDGYLRKNAHPEEVVHAVKKILAGEEYVSETVAQHLALEAKSDTIKLPHETLSSRESEVFQLLVAGKGITEIAETLKLNVTTVSTYRARILEKIDTKTNADLVRYVMHHNLVQ
jgi:two-component system invasion response regulator UvrY